MTPTTLNSNSQATTLRYYRRGESLSKHQHDDSDVEVEYEVTMAGTYITLLLLPKAKGDARV